MVPDPTMVESGLPVLTDPGVCAVVKTTIQPVEFVGTGLTLGSRKNGGVFGGGPLATGGHFMMVGFGMGSRAQRAEGSLGQADLGIRAMTELPAASTLGKANTFLSGGDDEMVLVIHKGFPNEVLQRFKSI